MRNAATATPNSKVVDEEEEVGGVDALLDLAIDSSCDALCGVARVDHGPLCLGVMFSNYFSKISSYLSVRLAIYGRYRGQPVPYIYDENIPINNFLISNEKISKLFKIKPVRPSSSKAAVAPLTHPFILNFEPDGL